MVLVSVSAVSPAACCWFALKLVGLLLCTGAFGCDSAHLPWKGDAHCLSNQCGNMGLRHF